MKLKKIAGLAMREKNLSVCHWGEGGMCREMVGTPYALYAADELPPMGSEEWKAAMDIPADKRDEIMTHVNSGTLPGGMELDLETVLGGRLVQDKPVLTFLHKGRTIRAMEDMHGEITFLDSALLGPVEAKHCEMYVLPMGGRGRLFAVMTGMELRALLANYDIGDEETARRFDRVGYAIEAKSLRDAMPPQSAADAGEQMELNEEEAQA